MAARGSRWVFTQASPPACLPLVASVVVTRLEKINSGFADAIHKPVFLRNASRPTTGQDEFQRLRLPDSAKWILQNRFNKFQSSESYIPIRLDPVPKILAKFWMEDRFCNHRPVSRPTSRRSLSIDSGRVLPREARCNAVSSRRAFLGDRSK